MKGTQELFFFRCTKFDPCRSGKEHCMPLNVLYTSFVPFLLGHVVIWIIHIFLKITLVVSRSFIFYVSIHYCLFRETVCARIWATKMWGRGIMCTSFKINQIFPICFELVYLHSCVADTWPHVFVERKLTFGEANLWVQFLNSHFPLLSAGSVDPEAQSYLWVIWEG